MLRTTFFICALVLAHSYSNAAEPPVGRKVEFEQDIRPILVKHCFSCHGPEKQKGGLRLDRKVEALKGGDSGPSVKPGKSTESLLVHLVSGKYENRIMPPQGTRLTEDQIGLLRAWIDQGANWPGSTDKAENPLDWWSLRALSKPPIPASPDQWKERVRNPIDAFVFAKLKEKGLAPAAEADRRTLIRRLTFDLTGLPPTPEEIDAFESDSSLDAYEKLVDRLLASPHYGERWARHWLDVVHYGDTHGYDKDKLRPNAWPYRDYVIRALNADKPYRQFIQEQIAGDVLFPDTVDGVTALGFIAAGPWDFIGHAEVPETKIDGKVARHLDRDDMVANTMQTFISMTVQCAQCHNHKFDPIRQEEYYQLQAVFAALDRADRPYDPNPTKMKKFAELNVQRKALHQRLLALDAKIQSAGGKELAMLDQKIAKASMPAVSRVEFGYHSALSPKQDVAKWVQVDLGSSVPVDRVVLWGAHDDFNGIGAGFGFPVQFRIELCDDPNFAAHVILIADRTKADFPNPGITPQIFPAERKKGRYLRVTATKLAPRQNDYILALAELEALDKDGKNLAAVAQVAALDTIEALPRWGKVNLTDGFAPEKGAQTASEDAGALKKEREAMLARLLPPALRTEKADLTAKLAKTDEEMASVKPAGLVYAGMVHTGVDAFRGTGPEGKPRPIFVLKRGSVTAPLKEVAPGTLSVVPTLASVFDIPKEHNEGERRAALAKWLSDSKNPLPWRSIVNRVWQYHFGRGIVATPNDFGRMGQLPTHPELLDWLAVEFRDNGQSLKKLHKLLVTSTVYRQSSAGKHRFEALDTNNLYLWHSSRRKLEAEELRDAMLLAAGKLDRTMYGPGFQDFVIEHPEHSPHYEYHLHDPNDPKSHRRSIYRFLVRSKPQPFMNVLDCADPSMQVEKRNETLSPLQALSLLNNGFVLTMSKDLAKRVEKESGPSSQIALAFRLALGRRASPQELSALTEHAQMHGLPNACRVILNLNEFVFVD